MKSLIRITRISPEMKETNRLLARIADAQERTASALEAQNAMLGYVSAAEREAPIDPAIDARTDFLNEELAAAVENAEDMGIAVPLETYRHLGIPPPGQRDEVPEEELDELLSGNEAIEG